MLYVSIKHETDLLQKSFCILDTYSLGSWKSNIVLLLSENRNNNQGLFTKDMKSEQEISSLSLVEFFPR